MDFFWSWFYEQLEKQPKEEVELLRNAVEQALEAPLGMEPRASARLLQSRIGNQAMQRLIEMKTRQRQAQQPEKETEQVAEPVPSPEEVKAVTTVAEEETAPALEQVVEEPTPQPEEEKKPDLTAKQKVVVEPTAEEELAIALKRFSSTLEVGGGAKEWSVLNVLFKAASNPAQQQILKSLTGWVLALSQTPQQLFMQHLVMWRENSGSDELASLLWLRLRRLASLSAPQEQVENGGGNDS